MNNKGKGEFDKILNRKLRLFVRAVPPLLVMYLQGIYKKTGMTANVDNVIMMKLFYFFVLYGDLLNIASNFWAYPNGPVEEDEYFFLLNNQSFLQDEYFSALEQIGGLKARMPLIIGFDKRMKGRVEKALGEMEKAGIFFEDKRGLIDLSHESGAWLTAYLKSGGAKYPMDIEHLKKEREALCYYAYSN